MFNNKKLILSFFWVILGAALLGLSISEVLTNPVYAGMGGALIAVGALQIVRNLRYRKNPAYREKVDTAVRDERNTFLRQKSWAWTGAIVVLTEGVAAIVALALGQQTVQLVLSSSVCLIIAVYWLVYIICSRKY